MDSLERSLVSHVVVHSCLLYSCNTLYISQYQCKSNMLSITVEQYVGTLPNPKHFLIQNTPGTRLFGLTLKDLNAQFLDAFSTIFSSRLLFSLLLPMLQGSVSGCIIGYIIIISI